MKNCYEFFEKKTIVSPQFKIFKFDLRIFIIIMMANVFKKLGGARAGTINKIYEPMGYHEDDPHIELEGKTFDQVIQEIHEQGFTGRSSLVSLTKKQKVYAKVKRIPCGNTACSKMSKITWGAEIGNLLNLFQGEWGRGRGKSKSKK